MTTSLGEPTRPSRVNKHGLSRDIPEDVKRLVRRNSKFGCVFCRSMVYDYHHIDPAWVNAQTHDPARICLLCPTHHAEVTRKRLSDATIMQRYSHTMTSDSVCPPQYTPTFSGTITLGLGDSTFDFMPPDAHVLKYDDELVLHIGYTTDVDVGGFRPTITGTVFNTRGQPLVGFVDNELSIPPIEGVDVTMIGDTLKVRQQGAEPSLAVTFSPPNGIRLNHLQMRYKEVLLELDDTFGITVPCLSGRYARWLVPELHASGARFAFSYTSDRQEWDTRPEVRFEGDVGILLPYCGARIAVNAGRMVLPRFGCTLMPDGYRHPE